MAGLGGRRIIVSESQELAVFLYEEKRHRLIAVMSPERIVIKFHGEVGLLYHCARAEPSRNVLVCSPGAEKNLPDNSEMASSSDAGFRPDCLVS